jgi:cytochrome c-type biogenesis protein CcmH/NrfF
MDNNLPLQIRKFNEKLRAMNQANAKILTLNSQEARDLHAEIYDLMATIAELNKNTGSNETVIVNMDGGGFK